MSIRVFLTGVAMGAADVVPGVSGGTVAFISGIYFRLLNAIRSAPVAVGVLFSQGIKAAWERVDGSFLLVLFAGIVVSVISLARLITWLLAEYPTCIWGFFFGLILASSVYLGTQVRWRWYVTALFMLGLGIALMIAEIRPSEIEATQWVIFGSGAIAICAMILPGISGSFILLIIGMYPTVMAAIKSFDLAFIAVFAGGCLLGLLAFSHVLSFLIARFKDAVLGLLTGFLAGSLVMVWPWQHTVESYIKSDGRVVALQTDNVLPASYAELVQREPYTALVLALVVVGAALVYGLARVGPPEQH